MVKTNHVTAEYGYPVIMCSNSSKAVLTSSHQTSSGPFQGPLPVRMTVSDQPLFWLVAIAKASLFLAGCQLNFAFAPVLIVVCFCLNHVLHCCMIHFLYCLPLPPLAATGYTKQHQVLVNIGGALASVYIPRHKLEVGGGRPPL